MSRFTIPYRALAILSLCGASSFAQSSIPALFSNPGSTLTTAIVGVTSAQTARLNVLNLQPLIPGVTAIACPATLEFHDDSGVLLKQVALTTIAPSTAASLVFKPAVSSTLPTARAQVRAAVVTPPSTPASTGSGGGTVTPVSAGCNFFASLEITDDATGATHVFTTDLRYVTTYFALPLMLGAR